MPCHRVSSHASNVAADALDVLQGLGERLHGLAKQLGVFVRHDGRLELLHVRGGRQRRLRQTVQRVHHLLVTHLPDDRQNLFSQFDSLIYQRACFNEHFAHPVRYCQHVIHTVRVNHLCQLGAYRDELVHAVSDVRLDAVARAHDGALLLAPGGQRALHKGGDGELGRDVDHRLRHQARLVGLDGGVSGDDDVGVLHLNQHVHALQRGPHAEHVAHAHPAHPHWSPNGDSAGHRKLQHRLVCLSTVSQRHALHPANQHREERAACDEEHAYPPFPQRLAAKPKVQQRLHRASPHRTKHATARAIWRLGGSGRVACAAARRPRGRRSQPRVRVPTARAVDAGVVVGRCAPGGIGLGLLVTRVGAGRRGR
mmetsp:Transcript_26409/g.50157  ORF Transcript_26409/g.50157 Transcript_26409/m.50157 type:complete len:368 (+) Transcript_26409:387-1490(+)